VATPASANMPAALKLAVAEKHMGRAVRRLMQVWLTKED
jgi:hypothetical protein